MEHLNAITSYGNQQGNRVSIMAKQQEEGMNSDWFRFVLF
jgi:hypothetical protein